MAQSTLLSPQTANARLQDAKSGQIRIQSRSPHPYHRRRRTGRSQLKSSCSSSDEQPQAHLVANEHVNGFATSTASHLDHSRTPSDSDYEIENEAVSFMKALPAASSKPRKGLKTGVDDTVGTLTPTPLPSPGLAQQSLRNNARGFFSHSSAAASELESSLKEALERRARHRRRRNAEILRRGAEVASFGSIGYLVMSRSEAFLQTLKWQTACTTHAALLLSLCFIYVFRFVFVPSKSSYTGLRLRPLHIPSSFDPAPLLYPTFLPIMVALSLSSSFPIVLLPNVVLSLAAMPQELIPFAGYPEVGYNLHWLLTLLPITTTLKEKVLVLDRHDSTNHGLALLHGLQPEMIALLYPLHCALLRPLYYLTTTSLLSAELQLLCICFINVLILSQSSQIIILKSILWIGGLGMFILCGHVLHWNVALERIPPERFQRTALRNTSRNFLFAALKGVVSQLNSENALSHSAVEEIEQSLNDFSSGKACANGTARISDHSAPARRAEQADFEHRKTSAPENGSSVDGTFKPRRSESFKVHPFLSLTADQANIRKWTYAGYTYAMAALIILGLIRPFIKSQALHGNDPFLWAIGYLFGDLRVVRTTVKEYGMESWFPLPPNSSLHTSIGFIDRVRYNVIGEANTRLVLFLYWLTVVLLGIASVSQLSSLVEVDTRRKVFHGMMVAMLLPTTFIDPTFLALGLTLVLAVFLLLDLFRASQLRPLSQPLARFLSPYVDGRDHRGPVVISHMFLLIGCAIPLWLSLAGIKRTGSAPWEGWELTTRDVSMIAGVICVGMGDAAASLIGRRYGRRKWPWVGGKSLEGSLAFAVAVTIGLLFGKSWLRVGGWSVTVKNNDTWATSITKAMIAASGASFTEAVLTGCNDNVVVPLVLWLLVRSLNI